MLAELNRLVKAREDFAFESTLSGRTYLRMMRKWKISGYRIELGFLSLPSVHLALQRIAARVRQGGHDVPRADVCVDSTEVGRIFSRCIGRWQIRGQSMTTQGMRRHYWRKAHESGSRKSKNQIVLSERRAGTAASGEGGEEDGAGLSHPNLCVAERQGRRQETVTWSHVRAIGYMPFAICSCDTKWCGCVLTAAVHDDLALAIDRQRALFRFFCLGIPSHLPVEVAQQSPRRRLSHGVATGLRERARASLIQCLRPAGHPHQRSEQAGAEARLRESYSVPVQQA